MELKLSFDHDEIRLFEAIGLTEEQKKYFKSMDPRKAIVKATKFEQKLTEDELKALEETDKWSQEVKYLVDRGYDPEQVVIYVTVKANIGEERLC